MIENPEIDAILPCDPLSRDGNDLYRVRVCVESLRATGSLDTIKHVHVFTPARWREAIAELLSDVPYVTVLNELDILSTEEREAFLTAGGWFRQQILKLCANRVSQRRAYVTFDSDVLCAYQVTAADIFQGSKVYFQPQHQLPEWIANTSKLLKIKTIEAPTMGVTPSYLTRQGLEVVQEHLQTLLGSWIVGLAKAVTAGGWTEYMLYQGVLQKQGLWDELHVPVDARKPIYRGFWQKIEPSEKVVQETLALSPRFLVVQSLNKNWREFHDLLSAKGIFSYNDLSQDFLEHAKERIERIKAEIAAEKKSA